MENINSISSSNHTGNTTTDDTTDDDDDFLKTLEVCIPVGAPTAENLVEHLPTSGYILFGILCLFTVITIVIYLEEIVFLLKTFSISSRKKKTIWVLAFYPMFSMCGLLACFIPRCATLVDLIANLYFATCLYNFGRLIINYLGGSRRVWSLVGDAPRMVDFATLPVAIVRPLALFVAAVLWTNGSYVQGEMKISRAFLYITVINVTSTLIAVYGLMLLRKVFMPELEKKFKIGGKIASIQLCLIASIIPNLVLNLLLVNSKLPCTKLLSPKTIAEEILHISWILMMLPFSLLARKFFRTRDDAIGYADRPIFLIGQEAASKDLIGQESSVANNSTTNSSATTTTKNKKYDDDDDGSEYDDDRFFDKSKLPTIIVK
ncbi:hypothetical protein HELRODRAFT_159741 [Helobdella robusta]|uniref:Uncharacterized protein n=1 Tax=Helobdella robusta TaxID=6412 RepID=T1EPC9_HELRO|nr:hypothetical protein HELRODRAFT_159741 [Helobdella robusta]ESO13124.1 hypothetical protein HELRODRAFT_159741 [Helobdella robusta]